ncbi:MAG: exo-alpha-sialidase [Candidatus Dormibacteraeota bacterium]|nr:exo-alpha-sialidase [Candidatus Dormibacteraeota bacterium]
MRPFIFLSTIEQRSCGVTTTSFALRVGVDDNLGVAALIGTSAPGNTTGWTEVVANGRPMDWSLLGPIHVTSPSNPLVSGHTVLIPDVSDAGARLLLSQDGGRTWEVPQFKATGNIPWAIAAGRAFVVGLDAGPPEPSTLEISADGGHQWNQATPPFPGPLSFRMACQPNGRCVAADGENLWHAESFGATWTLQPTSIAIHEADSVFYAADATLSSWTVLTARVEPTTSSQVQTTDVRTMSRPSCNFGRSSRL